MTWLKITVLNIAATLLFANCSRPDFMPAAANLSDGSGSGSQTVKQVVDQDALRAEIAAINSKVKEFQIIQQAAEQRGVRVWLFGGTAHSVAMRARRNLLGQSYPFGTDVQDLLHWVQDIDIVIDGTPEDASYFEQLATTKLGHSQVARMAWEFRLLRDAFKGKEALIGPHASTLVRHSDSASLGMIELTTPAKDEPAIRDFRDWKGKTCEFIEDVAQAKIRLYHSPDHDKSMGASAGLNPPILEALRFVSKALHQGLAISPEDFSKIREMVAATDVKAVVATEYPRRWLIRNAYKLFYATQSFAGTKALLQGTGLDKVLAKLSHSGDEGHRYGEMAKEIAKLVKADFPLERSVGKGTGAKPANRGQLYYETADYLEFELNKFNPKGHHLLTFHKARLRYVNGNAQAPSGALIPVSLHSAASENTDFSIQKNATGETEVIVENPAAARVEFSGTEIFSVTPGQFYTLLKQNRDHRLNNKPRLDFRIIERLRLSLANGPAPEAKEIAQLEAYVQEELKQERPDFCIMREWYSLPGTPVALGDGSKTNNTLGVYAVTMQTLGSNPARAKDQDTLQFMHDAIDAALKNVGDDYADTIIKDFFKSPVLPLLPKELQQELLTRIASSPDFLNLFTERFVGRMDVSLLDTDRSSAQRRFNELVAVAETTAKETGDATLEQNLQAALANNPSLRNPSNTAPEVATTAKTPNTQPSAPTPLEDTVDQEEDVDTAIEKDSFVPPPRPKNAPPPKLVKTEIDKMIAARDPHAITFSAASEKIFTDKVALDYSKDELEGVFGRLKEAIEVMDTLVRHKGKNPVLVGEAGVGKTKVMELVAQLLHFNEIPEAKQFQTDLKDSIVVITSPGRISRLAKSNAPSAQAAAVEEYIDAIKVIEKKLQRKIILFVDEVHRFEPAQIEALKPYLDSSDGIMLVGASTDRELLIMTDRNEAFARRIHRVGVREFTPAETERLLMETVVPLLQKKYSGITRPSEITRDAVNFTVRRALEYNPDVRRPEGPFKLLQAATVQAHREAKQDGFKLDDDGVAKFLVEALHLRLDPTNLQTFAAGIKELRADMLKTVIEQERVVDAMMELWGQIYFATEPKDSVKVLLIAGPTGSGKSFSAREFARLAMGDERRMLEIDCTKFETGGLSLNSLLGAPNGVVSSDKTKGMLPEFLVGRGRGMNVIVLNEFDKAHPDLAKQMMEMIDTGKLQGGDGQTYFTGRSLVVITTNKGDDHIYPRDRDDALTRAEIQERVARITDENIKTWFMESPKGDLYDTSKSLPPSFLQRIDRAVPAPPVSMEGALVVAIAKFQKAAHKVFETHGFKIELHKQALEHIVKTTYIPENGVREVERVVEKIVYRAMEAVDNDVKKGECLRITLDGSDPQGPQFRVAVVNPSDKEKTERKVGTFAAAKGRKHVDNPLMDESVRARLNNIEEKLGKRVFGQPDAIRLTARAIRAREINLQNNRPTSLLFLGPTGIGKTELAKTVAQNVYGSDKRIAIFDMGSVKWEGDFNNIFGSPKGFVGSGTPPPFEQFLNDFPEGGVIVFDEIGNMGGGSKKVKNDLLKRFYAMLEEGEWRSVHGKLYPLKKYVLVFTSNEGQELFYDLPSDDLRLSAWKAAKDKETIRKILLDAGWPEPFIGRMGEMVMFRPLLKDSRVEVAMKEIARIIDTQLKQYKGLNVDAQPDFFEQVAESFFSHAEGGRSIRKFADTALTDLIGRALMGCLEKYPNLSQTKLTFELTDNYNDLLVFEGNFPPRREVQLTITAMTGENQEVFRANLSKDAPAKRLVARDELKLTAYHEAGHAVANDVKISGQVVAFVTIVGQGGYGGYARYEDVGTGRSPTRESVIARIATSLAGGMAEARARGNGQLSAGRSQDLKSAWNLARTAIVKWGLADNAHTFPVDQKGNVDVKDKTVQAEIKKLLEEGGKLSEDILNKEWQRVTVLAEALLEKHVLQRADLDQILDSQSGIESLEQHDAEETIVVEHESKGALAPLLAKDDETRVLKIGCGNVFEN